MVGKKWHFVNKMFAQLYLLWIFPSLIINIIHDFLCIVVFHCTVVVVLCVTSVAVIVRHSGCCLVSLLLSLSNTVVVLCVTSLLLSLSDTVVVVLCVTSVAVIVRHNGCLVYDVCCCHCQTQWLSCV